MSQSESASGWDVLDEYTEEIQAGVRAVKQAVTDEDDETLLDEATDLWEILDEFEDVLDTMDLSEVIEAIEFNDLPEAIDVEDVAEGMTDPDESAIDLTHLKEAVNLRELWNAMDLTEFVGEAAELDDAVDDVTDGDDGFFENVVDGPRLESDPSARQAYIQEMIAEAAEEFREVILASHGQFRRLYRENQERFGDPGRQPDSLNPTAYSTLPPGPLPDSVSTRTSTVPSRVRHSSADYQPERIYGRRFVQATSDDTKDSGAAEDDQTDEADDSGEPTAEPADGGDEMTDQDADDPPTIKVHDPDG